MHNFNNFEKIQRQAKPALKNGKVYESDNKRRNIKNARKNKRIQQAINF